MKQTLTTPKCNIPTWRDQTSNLISFFFLRGCWAATIEYLVFKTLRVLIVRTMTVLFLVLTV